MGTGLPFKLLLIVITVVAQSLCSPAPDRTTICINGACQIEDWKDTEAFPVVWNQKAAVPALARSADPAFPPVDEFDSRTLIQNRADQGSPSKARTSTTLRMREFRFQVMPVNDKADLTLALENSNPEPVRRSNQRVQNRAAWSEH